MSDTLSVGRDSGDRQGQAVRLMGENPSGHHKGKCCHSCVTHKETKAVARSVVPSGYKPMSMTWRECSQLLQGRGQS